MERWGIDYLAFSAHKAYAPFGCGVSVAKKSLLGFSPAEMELIQSSGKENVAGIGALGKALVLLRRVALFPQVSLPGLARVSLGTENGKEDVDTLIHVLGKIARQPLARADIQQQMDGFARAAAQRVYARESVR